GKVEIDTRLLAKQAKDAIAPCVFLSEDGRCGVYSARPAVCRKYHVVSPKENCGSDTLPVIPKIDLVPELIASAALSLPDNKIGFMNDLLNERINRPIQFEAALPGLDIAP
ncbi:MAG: YkgJ family cysteine cluster protein, partial [Bdellovibrionota bacterium]